MYINQSWSWMEVLVSVDERNKCVGAIFWDTTRVCKRWELHPPQATCERDGCNIFASWERYPGRCVAGNSAVCLHNVTYHKKLSLNFSHGIRKLAPKIVCRCRLKIHFGSRVVQMSQFANFFLRTWANEWIGKFWWVPYTFRYEQQKFPRFGLQHMTNTCISNFLHK